MLGVTALDAPGEGVSLRLVIVEAGSCVAVATAEEGVAWAVIAVATREEGGLPAVVAVTALSTVVPVVLD